MVVISTSLIFFMTMIQVCMGACDTSGILNFRLVRSGAGGGRDLQTLAASRPSVIPLKSIDDVSIEANVCHGQNRLGLEVDSVCFTLSFDGEVVLEQTENRDPYYANGDNREEGTVNALQLDFVGIYTLLAETYDANDCEGTRLGSETLLFTTDILGDGAPPAPPEQSPNIDIVTDDGDGSSAGVGIAEDGGIVSGGAGGADRAAGSGIGSNGIDSVVVGVVAAGVVLFVSATVAGALIRRRRKKKLLHRHINFPNP